MTAPVEGARQFKAEAQEVSEEERMAMELLEKKRAEREAKAAAELPPEEEAAPVTPEDDPLHMELQAVVEDRDGDLFDTRNGKLVEWNDDGLLRYAPEWHGNSFEFMGDVWQYREPKKIALMFMGASSRKQASPRRRLESMIGFLEHTLSQRSLDRLYIRAFDREDPFEVGHMGTLMQSITQKKEGVIDSPELESGTASPKAVE